MKQIYKRKRVMATITVLAAAPLCLHHSAGMSFVERFRLTQFNP